MPFSLPGTESVPFASSRGATKFDLSLRAAERDGYVRGIAEYRTDLYDADTIDRLLGHFGTLLGSALDTPDLPVGDLSLLDDAERRKVLIEWNDSGATYPEHGPSMASSRPRWIGVRMPLHSKQPSMA